MKKILLFLLFVTGICQAQIVFPDANLKAMLVAASPDNPIAFTEASYPNGVTIDTNGDGEIQLSEALPITRLNCGISSFDPIDLEGLQYFTNLEEFKKETWGNLEIDDLSPLSHVKRLIIPGSNVDYVDISPFSQLEELDMTNSHILTIAIGTLPNLKVLKIGDNYLSSLDLSGVPNLMVLDFTSEDGFQFAAPDVSGLIHLTELYLSNNYISSLNVSALTNLTKLYCKSNPLGTLDVSNLANLKELNCYMTGLTTLDVSMLTQLEILNIGQNQIPSVNITSGSHLKELEIQYTLITEFDATPHSNLQVLNCGNGSLNPMTLLTLTPSLKYLYIDGYTPTELTLSLPLLQRIDIKRTSLLSLDISACPMVNYLSLLSNPNIEYLNAKNGLSPDLMIHSNPNLLMVCLNENDVTYWQGYITAETYENNPNCQVNSYCSFTPGGIHNTITGKIRFDDENNGCDANDVVFPYAKVTMDDGMQSGIAYANPSGIYKFYTQTPSTFSLTAAIENPSYYNITPSPSTFDVTTIDGSTTTVDFCVTANGIHPDAEIMIVPIDQARPGFDASYKLVYRNKGNQTLNGWISANFDDARTDFVSASPGVTQTGNMLVFGYANLAPFETRSVDFTINLNGPMETPALNDGDILDFYTNLNFSDQFGNVSNQANQLHQTIVNSLDPNDKTCLEGNTISPEMIGEYVHYNINFENIGTAEAINIVVKDQIDAAKFEISTLQVVYASHPVVTRINGNRVDFIFENINLPGTSGQNKGNVLFKIKTKPNLVLGNSISNKAEIFFDYNFPIETNEATSTFSVLKNKDFVADATIGVQPNPTKGKVDIKANSNIRSLQLFDMQGRLLQTSTENTKETSIDISGKQDGIYFLNVTTEKGSKIEKIIKE